MSSSQRHRATALTLRLGLALLVSSSLAACGGPEVRASGQVEYGHEAVDAMDYLELVDGKGSIEEAGSIDASQVGTQTIEVRTKGSLFSGTHDVEVVVRDTQAPDITLSKTEATCEYGETFIASSLVEAVSDPVDGDLEPVDSEPETEGTAPGFERFYDQGWYLIQMPEDVAEVGTHQIGIVACDQHGNRSEAQVELEVKDPLEGVKIHKTTTELEYEKTKIDPATLVTCTDEETTVTAEPLSTGKVGKKVVTFTLKKHQSEREVTRTFRVRDTRPPEVILERTSVVVELGGAYDPASNVLRVADPVDGDLERQESEPEKLREGVGTKRVYRKGWYTVSGDVNTTIPGTYPVTVNASDRHGNLTTQSFDVLVVDPLEGATITQTTDGFEYGRGTIDPTRYLSCSVEGATISASPVDVSTLGTKQVNVTISKGGNSASVVLSFAVRDTQSPTIAIKSSNVSISAGSSYNPQSNVQQVSDPVDGNLTYVSSEPSSNGNGWYTITGNYSTSTAGSYTLTVVACDHNGNRTTRPFTLKVTEG